MHRPYIPSFLGASASCLLLDVMITSPIVLRMHDPSSASVDLLSEAKHSKVNIVSHNAAYCFVQLYSIVSDRPDVDSSLSSLMFSHATDI